MTDASEPLVLWVVLGALAVGPLFSAVVVFLRHGVNVELFLSVAERMLRAGQHERFAKLVGALTETQAAPAAELVGLAWGLRFEVLDQAPPSATRGYRVLAGPAEKPYPERMRERLAGDTQRLRMRIEWTALPAMTGLASPALAPWLAKPTPETAWVLSGLTALVALAALLRARANLRNLELVLRRCPELFDPSLAPTTDNAAPTKD